MRSTVSILLFLCDIVSSAQRASSLDTRHATGTGPYPIYIGIQRAWPSSSISEFERITSFGDLHDLFPRAGVKARPSGFNVKVGFIYANGKFLWPFRGHSFPNYVFELDYLNMVENFKGDGSLRLFMETLTVRAGRRFNLFYPLSAQITIGPVTYQSTGILLNRNDKAGGSLTASEKPGGGFFGLDGRARLNLMDPAGAAGGIGIIIEGQWTYMIPGKNQPLDKLYAVVDPDASVRPEPRLSFITWSTGVSIPLALRFK